MLKTENHRRIEGVTLSVRVSSSEANCPRSNEESGFAAERLAVSAVKSDARTQTG